MNFKTEKPWRIIAGAASAVFVPLILIVAMEGPLVEDVQAWQVFLGPYYGALFGLLTILAGALYNAELNRRRDDWLHEHDVRSLAAALRAEMLASGEHLELVGEHIRNIIELRKNGKKGSAARSPMIEQFERLWIPRFPVFHANLARLGILGADRDYDVIRAVIEVDMQMTAIVNLRLDGEALVERVRLTTELALWLRAIAEDLRVRAKLPKDENSTEFRRRGAEMFKEDLKGI